MVGALSISHLFFIDDCLLYCRAKSLECKILREIITEFANASRQVINQNKSSVIFSRNVSDISREVAEEILEVKAGDLRGNYLGLPSLTGRKKREILGFIKNKFIGRIKSWNGKFLSRAGREILMKNVVQAIPTYAMSVFLLPSELCHEIEIAMNGYWWNVDNNSGKGIRWKDWKALSRPKKLEGMGYRTLREFNLDLLGKQA